MADRKKSDPAPEQADQQTGGQADEQAADADVAGLGYENAREQLLDVVRRLESGGATLEESLALWERGEALAARCEQWLAGARQRVEDAVSRRAAPPG